LTNRKTLCRYLFTEWEDPEFGGRASAVHSGLVNALAGAGRVGEAVWLAIRRQTDMMSQLAYITKELKVWAVISLQICGLLWVSNVTDGG
jgi:hypothetical protein